MSGGRMERVVSSILRSGVLTSLVVILVGAVVSLVHHPEYLKSSAELDRLTRPGAAVPQTLGEVAAGVVALQGRSIVSLGLLLLILTPVLRVVVSIFAFAKERDRLYVLITSGVLALLVLSFLLGRGGG